MTAPADRHATDSQSALSAGSDSAQNRQCGRCGASLTDRDIWDGCHVRSEHAPTCDGTEIRCLESCPVAVQCGPVVTVCECSEHPMAPHLWGEPPCVNAPKCPDCFSVHCPGALGEPCGEPNADPYYASLGSHPDA